MRVVTKNYGLGSLSNPEKYANTYYLLFFHFIPYSRYTKNEANIVDDMLLFLQTKNKNNDYSTISIQMITIKQPKDR